MGKRIAVVGAGVGGLATAARLAKSGHEVQVYEKLPECGGRAHMIRDKGFSFDTGPSFVLMPDFFEEVFAYCGKDIKDYLDLKQLDIHYNIFYPDRDTLSIYCDYDRTKKELEKIEKGSSVRYDELLKELGKIYHTVQPLLYKCFTPNYLFRPNYWGLVTKLKVFGSYWKLAKKYFKSDKLAYAFTFEAMFIGVSPFDAPAFYSIITYTDHVQKIFHPMGGMYEVPLALERLGKEFGVSYHYNSEVQGIEQLDGSIKIKVAGREVRADSIVVNADYPYVQETLLGRKIPKYKYSCSVYLLYLGLKRKIKGFAHHNLFFSSDLKKNLSQIFDVHETPQDPSFYVHVPTVTDPSLAPPNKDLFYILVPVSNLERQDDFDKHEDRIRKLVFDKINKVGGINLENEIEVEHRFYPKDFISRYNIKYGATFGLAHSLMQSAFFRPANFDSKIKNLYFVGASTQPGGGLPPVIASSKIAADLINSSSS